MSKITLLVCTHRRFSDTTPSCAARGGEELFKKLQIVLQEFEVNVETVDCFGHCENGATVRISPSGSFYHHVTLLDISKIIAEENLLMTTKSSLNTAPSIANADCFDID